MVQAVVTSLVSNMADPYSLDQLSSMDPTGSLGLQPQGFGYVPTQGALIQQEGLTKWLQNPKEILKEIAMKLKGLEYNRQTKSYIRLHNQLLSDEGIEIILATLNFHINKTITLSNIDELMINFMALEIHGALASSLHQNWVRAGLLKEPLPPISKDKDVKIVYLPNNYIILSRKNRILQVIIPRFNSSLYKVILSNLDHIIYANLRRAKDGGERNFLTKITTEQVQSIRREDDGSKQDGGMLNKFLGVPSLFKK